MCQECQCQQRNCVGKTPVTVLGQSPPPSSRVSTRTLTRGNVYPSKQEPSSFCQGLGVRITGKTNETKGALGRCLPKSHSHERNNGNGCKQRSRGVKYNMRQPSVECTQCKFLWGEDIATSEVVNIEWMRTRKNGLLTPERMLREVSTSEFLVSSPP